MTHWRASQLKSRPAVGANPPSGPHLRDTQRNNVILFASNPEGKCAAVLTLASPQKLGETAAIISRPDPADQEFAALILFSIVVAVPASIVMLMVMIVLEFFY